MRITKKTFVTSKIMSPLFIAISFLAILQQSLCSESKNEMKDRIREYLQLDADSPYEFFKIEEFRGLRKRDFSGRTLPAGTHIRIRVFDDDVDLWLHPKDSLLATEDMPVYWSEYSQGAPGNVSIRRRSGMMKQLGQLYEDPERLASLIIGKDNFGRMTMNGEIQSIDAVIRSLPENVVEKYVDQRGSMTDDVKSSDSAYHVVYRMKNDRRAATLRGNLARMSYGIPHILHPKILLVVDYSIYRQNEHNVWHLLEYLLAFSNGLDLKYRSLESPRIRLHISAIVFESGFGGLPYMSEAMLGGNVFHGNNAMIYAKKFFYDIRESISLESYDIALTLTELVFGPSSSTIGLGWVGTTCRNSRLAKSMEAVAIIRDDGAFSGVHIAAHEMGHVFGLRHDGVEEGDCMYNNGFIMSFTPWYTSNSTSFSSCSLKAFQQALENNRYGCMYDRPRGSDRKLPNLMPGRVKSLKDQCLNMDYGLPCNTSVVDICVNVHCLAPDGECLETNVAALEGTLCSDENEALNRYCVYNRCVNV